MVPRRVTAEAPYEPVDGCFAVVDDTEPAPGAGAHLRIQLVLGLRADRPGVGGVVRVYLVCFGGLVAIGRFQPTWAAARALRSLK